MARKLTAKQQEKADSKRIESLYYKRCDRVQINIMDISKVFDAGQKAIDANRDITDEALGDVIAVHAHIKFAVRDLSGPDFFEKF